MVQVVESLSNISQPTDDDNEDNLFQMVNSTSQYTQILPQLMYKMQQMQTIMSQMQTQKNNNNKSFGGDNRISGDNKSKKVPFWRKLYYWNHGECNHQGNFCRSKSEVKKDNSTFCEQLNGRDRNFHHRENKNNDWRCNTDSEVIDKDKNNSSYFPITFPSIDPTSI